MKTPRMYDLENRQVLVIGLGTRGRAACKLLRNRGANVLAVDEANTEDLRAEASRLRPLGIEVALGVSRPPDRQFALAVVSPAVPCAKPIVQEVIRRRVPVIAEIELGYQQAQCLNISIAGATGRRAVGELVEFLLNRNHRKTAFCGSGTRPLCSLVPRSKHLDFLILETTPFELERTELFRPAVGVLLGPDTSKIGPNDSQSAQLRANARLFQNQEAFDWAVIQADELARLRALDLAIPSKIISFSAHDREADIHFDRGMLVSRLPEWTGPLLDLNQPWLRGHPNPEYLMAALAVGHILHVPLGAMINALKALGHGVQHEAPAAQNEEIASIERSKVTHPDTLRKALQTVPAPLGRMANIWLIANNQDKMPAPDDTGPLLSRRVKGAFMIGGRSPKNLSTWNRFTPCTLAASLLEAVKIAARKAAPGDVILLSPACSNFDQFGIHQHPDEVCRDAVNALAATMGGGGGAGRRDMRAVTKTESDYFVINQ